MAGGAGELFVGGFLNLTTCRQRPIGRAGRAQDAQDATFRPVPSGSYPSRPPWIVGLSRGLCRGLRRTNKLPRPPCRCRGAGRPPPASVVPAAPRWTPLPTVVANFQRDLGSTLPKSFLPPHTPKTRALATPDACEGVPVPPWGGLRAFTVRTREGVTLYACKVTFFRAFALLVRLAFRFDFL